MTLLFVFVGILFIGCFVWGNSNYSSKDDYDLTMGKHKDPFNEI